MNQTDRLIKTIENYYGNGHMGLASQVGYLTGVLKSLEREYKSAGGFIEEHTDFLLKELELTRKEK
jgi:hypothetical protein